MYLPKKMHRDRLAQLVHMDRTMKRLDTASSTFAASAIGLMWCVIVLMICGLLPSTLECICTQGVCVAVLIALSLLTDMFSQYIGNKSDKWERESKRILRNRKR